MQTYNNQKPEYVLKRANDIINSAVGNAEKEKTLALEILHNFIGAKKKVQQWSKVYEVLMKRHLELCIDLKNPHLAKDGLHQYRNLCQLMDPNSLEVVIMHMMEITESEATAARARADKVALAAAAKVSDLEQEESPESIMLSSMTEEGSKDRTDREVVLPWLRFLWETFRAVLELLYKLPRMDRVYHKICEKALKFCLDYNRTMEFRRLCELLRSHLNNIQNLPVRPGKTAWEWTSDLVELHLQTRFYQLEVATTLEQWNEAFRTIEDIHDITVAGRKTPKPNLMAVFYEKLTRIFWVSGNNLFHAFAWSKYFSLTCEYRKDLKADEKSSLASYVLLSALSIPTLKDTDQSSVMILDDDKIAERNQAMANLLDFQIHPSRKALVSDMVSKGILQDVFPELSGLYNLLDKKFHPLTMVQSLKPTLDYIKNHSSLHIYLAPLQRVVILRVLQQLSKVYSVVKLDYLHKLLSGLYENTSIHAIEKIILDGVMNRELYLTVDHINNCIRFNNIPVSTVVDTQVAQLGTDLSKIANTIEIETAPEVKVNASIRRKAYFDKVRQEADAYHTSLLNRKGLIEQRKIEIEKALEEKERIQQMIMSREDQRRQKDESARLELERQKREEEKRKKLLDKEDVKRVQKELERLGVFKEESVITTLDTIARQNLVLEAKAELQKAKDEENRKVTEHARRLDHITRALRIEATEVIKKRYEMIIADDRAVYEANLEKVREDHKVEHIKNLDEKKRLQKMQFAREVFEQSLLADQYTAYEKRKQALKEKALREYRERKIATARRKMYEEMERQRIEEELERERRDKEERARQEREQYELLRRQREEEEAVEKAKEMEEKRLAEERRLELEAKRQRAIEEKKRALHAVTTPAAGASSASETVSSHPTPPGEKEIVWRVPSSVASTLPSPTATTITPKEVKKPMDDEDDGEGEWKSVGPSKESSATATTAATTGGGSGAWRPPSLTNKGKDETSRAAPSAASDAPRRGLDSAFGGGSRPRGGDTASGAFSSLRRDSGGFGGEKPRESFGDRPRGGEGFGDRPRGGEGFGDRPRGGEGFGDRPRGGDGFGDRPRGGDGFGDRPRGGDGFGDRPRGGEGFGDRPRGGEGFGDRPRGGDQDRRRDSGLDRKTSTAAPEDNWRKK